MVKVKMLVHFVGPGINWPIGEEVELDEVQAARMLAKNMAEPVKVKAEVKRADPETKRNKKPTSTGRRSRR